MKIKWCSGQHRGVLSDATKKLSQTVRLRSNVAHMVSFIDYKQIE